MIPLTHLERGVLDGICDQNPALPELRQLLSTAMVSERENTGYGFYTKLHLMVGEACFCRGEIDSDVYASMLGMGEGMLMDFHLHFRDGRPTTLEGWQSADEEKIVDLHTFDLAALRFSEISK